MSARSASSKMTNLSLCEVPQFDPHKTRKLLEFLQTPIDTRDIQTPPHEIQFNPTEKKICQHFDIEKDWEARFQRIARGTKNHLNSCNAQQIQQSKYPSLKDRGLQTPKDPYNRMSIEQIVNGHVGPKYGPANRPKSIPSVRYVSKAIIKPKLFSDPTW